MEDSKQERLKFPDYDPDVMATSDARAIISHFEEVYPDLYVKFEKDDILMAYLYRHVDYFMDYIEVFKKDGFRLQSAREFALNIVIDDIKNESLVIRKEGKKDENTLPSILFDLDINSEIDTDTF